jgi:hypothetical protein
MKTRRWNRELSRKVKAQFTVAEATKAITETEVEVKVLRPTPIPTPKPRFIGYAAGRRFL